MINPESPDYSYTPVSPRRSRYGYIPADPSPLPCVSVVTPFYNTGEIFHETARSMLGQSLQQWEWLIINDASFDPAALAILDEYRSGDPRIRVIDLDENGGPGMARNLAFSLARSEYVALLDSDDLLEPTTLEKWYWFLVSYPEYSFVKCYTVGFGADNYLWIYGFHTPNEFLRDNQVDSASMVRKSVHEAIGGYDDSLRQGLEDWDYWLHCAHEGYWGDSIPEYLNWYRRRPDHNDRWENWDYGKRQASFQKMLRQRYPRLWERGFPNITRREMFSKETLPDTNSVENRLQKAKPRLLMIVPWMTSGGADKFNLDLAGQLTSRGWEVSIAATVLGDNSWLPLFAQYTPDIFILNNFLHLTDQPRFLRYLIASRQVDVVMVTNSEMGYMLLPYLRAHCPEVTFVDYCHMEEEYWKNGGYPRMAIDYQEQLDRNIVASKHIREWMISRNADERRISVCYINVDTEVWRPDPELRKKTRGELGFQDDLPVILFVGRIVAQKQPAVLGRVMVALRQRGLRFKTLVAGNGPDFEWLKGYVKKHDLEAQMLLLGEVSSQRVRELMNAAEILFLPSSWEGIAMVIYEAMACGLPVVAANVGGQHELLTPECGSLVDLADEETQVQQYSDQLSNLVEDAEKRRVMGRAGRERVCNLFTIEQMGERMTAILAEAQKDHACQPGVTPSLGLARVTAAQAIEYIRLSQVTDRLWAEHHPDQSLVVERNRADRRALLYGRLYRWHEPIYRWYSKRGLDWIKPLRESVKKLLLH